MSNASREETDRESLIDQFQNVTGTSNESATAILEACNWNLELAINMHVDGIQSNDIVELPTNSFSNNANPSVSQSADDSDYIRAPIPPVRQVLVEDDFTPTVSTRRTQNNVFDSFRDFQSEAKWQEQMQATSSSSNGESSSSSFSKSKKQTLFDLFRPPLDIMFRGNLEGCKEEGTKLNKWLLVNVQNFKEFSCQVLNRDVWSNSAVKEIIKEHFIFWQICMENNDGQRYIQFYNVHEYPHISILDPRTGEKIRTLNASNVDTFCENLIEFISEHPSPSGSVPVKNDSKATSQKSTFDSQKIYNQSEAAQIEAAIAASLREINSENKNLENEIDSDIEIDNAETATENSNVENWKDYLGPEDGKEAKILFRFPDGTKEQISFPASSQLKALFLYISSKSYNLDKFDLVMNFPSRNLNDLQPSETLIQAGLYPSTILYVQQKS